MPAFRSIHYNDHIRPPRHRGVPACRLTMALPITEGFNIITASQHFRFIVGAVALCIAGGITAQAALRKPLYWDANGATAGSGNSGGSWSGSNWTTNSAGTATTGLWFSGSDAVFSAGSDGTGAISVTLSTSETLHNLTVSAGSVTLSGAGLSLSSLTTSATWTANAGTTLNVQSSLNANGNVLTVGGGGNTTFGGVITTTRGLNKSGSGTLVLAANNSLSGGVAVQTGMLKVENAGALGPGGSGNDTSVATGAALQLQNAGNISNVVLTVGGSGTSGDGALQLLQGNSVWSGPMLLSADTLVNTVSGSLNLSGYLLGGFNVAKTGTGTMVLSGSNAAGFFGSINVQAGTLEVTNGGALGLSAGGGTVSIAAGATLAVHGGISIPAQPLALTGNGLGGSGALRNTSRRQQLCIAR